MDLHQPQTPVPPPVPDGILPWSRSCFVCGESNPHGLRLRSRTEGGVVVLNYAPRAEDLGWRQIVHGGIGTTLMDEVMTWAAILCARRPCVAAEITVRMRQPIAVGQPLRIEGAIERGKPRLMFARGCILDAGGEPLMEATGKFVPMDEATATLCTDDFVEGPGAIPVAAIFQRG